MYFWHQKGAVLLLWAVWCGCDMDGFQQMQQSGWDWRESPFHWFEWWDEGIGGLLFTARGKMTSIFVFCGQANFLIKVRDSAADSPCYLWRRRGERKETLPGRENTGHFDVTCYVLEDGKASDLPHAGYYGYNLRGCINVPSNVCCPALITQNPNGIYEAVDFFTAVKAALLFGVCVVALGWTHTAVTESSLFISQLLVSRGSCISSPTAVPVLFAISTFEREKMCKLSDSLASAQPCSLVDAHHQSPFSCTLCVVDPRRAGIIWSSSNDAVGLDPGERGADAAHIPTADLLKSHPISHHRFPFSS